MVSLLVVSDVVVSGLVVESVMMLVMMISGVVELGCWCEVW